MNFTTHKFAQCAVDHLMPLQGAFASKFRADHDGIEMRVVIAADTDLTFRHPGNYEFFDFCGRHKQTDSSG